MIIDETFEGKSEAIGELLVRASDEIPKPIRFQAQPESFNGIKVWRVGREINRLKVVPVQTGCFMPRSVIQDEQLPLAVFLGNGFGKLIEEKLEYVGVDAIDDQTKERPGLRTDRTNHVLADVITQIWNGPRLTRLRPASTWPRIALDAGFVGEPEFKLIFLCAPFLKLRFEFFALGLILSLGPRTRYAQIEIQLMEPAQRGPIAQFNGELLF